MAFFKLLNTTFSTSITNLCTCRHRKVLMNLNRIEYLCTALSVYLSVYLLCVYVYTLQFSIWSGIKCHNHTYCVFLQNGWVVWKLVVAIDTYEYRYKNMLLSTDEIFKWKKHTMGHYIDGLIT